jgi:hypothetical protein
LGLVGRGRADEERGEENKEKQFSHAGIFCSWCVLS